MIVQAEIPREEDDGGVHAAEASLRRGLVAAL